jgi:outer membrane protein OmpA-like peptidoglycan-associated protein
MGCFDRKTVPSLVIALAVAAALTASGAETAGKIGQASRFDITKASADDIAQALKTDGRVVIGGGLLFESDSTKLAPSAADVVKRISDMMKRNPDLNVAVIGHTDSTGDFDHNRELSQHRAQAVVDALVKDGVAKTRLAAVGFGSLSPVAPNDTPEGRAQNRRVELVLLTLTPRP